MAAGYPLQALLSVRLYREDAAKTQVNLAEKKLLLQQSLVMQAKQELETYAASMPEKIDAEYSKIIGKECTLEDLDKVKHKVTLINQGLADREMKVLEEEKQVKICEEELAKARQAVITARKDAAKIETHKGIWQELEKAEAARQEDLEMEEFSGKKNEG